MKKGYILLPFTVLGILLGACTEKPMDNDNQKPDEVVLEEIPLAPTLPSDISSIYEINGEAIVNSHSDCWKNANLQPDWSNCVNLKDLGVSWEADAMQATVLHRLADGKLLLVWAKAEGQNKFSLEYATGDALRTLKYEAKICEIDKAYGNSRISLANLSDKQVIASFTDGEKIYCSIYNGSSWSKVATAYEAAENTAVNAGLSVVQNKNLTQIYFSLTDRTKQVGEQTYDEFVRMIQSNDAAANWSAAIPVAGMMRGFDSAGNIIYTDASPAAIIINGNRGVAIAAESQSNTGSISFAYDSNGEWKDAYSDGAAKFPIDRNDNQFAGLTSPTLCQFPSGESVLGLRNGNDIVLHIGSSIARNFDLGASFTALTTDSPLYSISVIGAKTLAVTAGPMIYEYILNHKQNAAGITPAIDGNNEDWAGVNDAYYMSNAAGVELSLRFAYNEDWLFILAERLDEEVLPEDELRLVFQGGDGSGQVFTVNLTPDLENGCVVCENKAIGIRSNINTTNEGGKKKGYIAELGIHRSRLRPSNDRILFNAVMKDGEKSTSFNGLSESNFNKWLAIDMKEFTQPDPEPVPSTSDLFNEGPSWSEGGTINPW